MIQHLWTTARPLPCWTARPSCWRPPASLVLSKSTPFLIANVLRLFLRLSISPNCSRNVILELLVRIQVQSMRALLKTVSSPPYWSPVFMSFPRPTLDLPLRVFAITLSSSTTISSSVLLNQVLLDRTYRGIHGVLNILGSYLNVFLQIGYGNFFFFDIWLFTYGQQLKKNCTPDMFTASESSTRHRNRSKYSILQGQCIILTHPELMIVIERSCDQILHLFQKNLYSSKMSWRIFLTTL